MLPVPSRMARYICHRSDWVTMIMFPVPSRMAWYICHLSDWVTVLYIELSCPLFLLGWPGTSATSQTGAPWPPSRVGTHWSDSPLPMCSASATVHWTTPQVREEKICLKETLRKNPLELTRIAKPAHF